MSLMAWIMASTAGRTEQNGGKGMLGLAASLGLGLLELKATWPTVGKVNAVGSVLRVKLLDHRRLMKSVELA